MTEHRPIEPRPSRATVLWPEDFERAPGPFLTASGARAYQTPAGPVPHVTLLHGPFPGDTGLPNAVQPEAHEDGDAEC